VAISDSYSQTTLPKRPAIEIILSQLNPIHDITLYLPAVYLYFMKYKSGIEE
jgi:hypothetical protein